MLRITYAFLLSASCHYHIQHEQYNGHCLYLLSTHFSGNSIHLFHLENSWSTLLRACGSELGEWVGTRFRPGQLIWCLPEACDLSWASGSLARTLTGTPEKKHFPSAEVLKLFECKLASHEPSLPLHGDPLSENEPNLEGHQIESGDRFLMTWVEHLEPVRSIPSLYA